MSLKKMIVTVCCFIGLKQSSHVMDYFLPWHKLIAQLTHNLQIRRILLSQATILKEGTNVLSRME
jgi:hypothetical protein